MWVPSLSPLPPGTPAETAAAALRRERPAQHPRPHAGRRPPVHRPPSPKAAGEFPTILIRTPYGRGKEVALWGGYALSDLPAQRFAERSYHVIVQGAWSRSVDAGEALAAGVRMAVAEQAIYHEEARPSALVLPIVEERPPES